MQIAKLKKKFGFTLVELMVTVSIVTVIMSVILFGYSSFNDNLTVSSATQEISLAIRQAQSYGLSVKEGTTAGDFSKAYGVSFSIASAELTGYSIFIDSDGDGKNDNATGSCTGECVEKVALRNGVKISAICGAILVSNSCSTSATSIQITFVRPSPDAIIRLYDAAGTMIGTTYYRGQISLISVKNKVGTITVEKTGQIYVQ